ncbi:MULTISPECIES: response regulator [Haloferax]|uniref:Response regulator n=2 Tax=Haloferax TaxID=2251 RepID=A0A6G1Z188_9EURY|nr:MULTISPECIES: HalOD1 output domain-containing protein [Haloferax]KAB1187641.1 response regulator [Haloferax sp. CBA1149]MRW80300.1 response regulator [Haloferax marinisediminis]
MNRPQSVLHVDDDPEMLALSAATFRNLDDVCLLTAETATEAIEVISNQRVDCVVSDSLVLPDGVPLVEAVRHADDDVPIVLFTAKDWSEVADLASAADVDEYVQKAGPDDFATVIRHVSTLVDEGDSDGALAQSASAVAQALDDHANAISDATLSLGEQWDLVGQWMGEEELGIVVVEAIESHAGLPAIEQPLYESVDADALEALLRPVLEDEERPGIEVRFPYGDFELAITSTGDIFARPKPETTLY